ncbi:MAG: endonuclease III [Tissierellia bacterium]|nr:endonuclease III [Tissierellia bacterium]
MRKLISKKEVLEVLDILTDRFPDAKGELDHTNPFELLVATILSAQCTDVRVNKVTKNMFPYYKTPEDYLSLGQEGLENIIRSCGFYRSKAKNILGACELLIRDFHGEVPKTIKELMTLPGVGRKTANVVASNAFGVPAIAVDTHVFRVSNRIGLAHGKNVEEVEEQLMKRIPKDRWTHSHHLLIFQGRRICASRRPKCEECPITNYCLYYKNGRKNH